MAKTEVILTHNIVGLGAESDQVKVAAGYARNFLFPQGLAIPLTSANKRRLEVLKQRRAEREAHDLNTMTDLAKSLSKLTCLIAVKTGEDGKMFGTVTSGLIADQLKTQFDVTLDKKKIHLEQPIRALGDHEIELRLHQDVKTTLKVHVESTTPPPVSPAAPAAEEKKEEPLRTEKRGRRPEAHAPGERAGKGEPTHRTQPGEQKGRAARPERPHRPEQHYRSDRPQRAEHPPRAEQSAKADKAPKPEKPAE